MNIKNKKLFYLGIAMTLLGGFLYKLDFRPKGWELEMIISNLIIAWAGFIVIIFARFKKAKTDN